MSGLKNFVLYFSIAFVIFCLIANYTSEYSELVYVRSTVDNTEYMVRNLPDKQAAADVLARLRAKMEILANYVYEHRDEQDEFCLKQILQLKARYQPEKLAESPPNSKHTSWSINKGEKIFLCVRNKSTGALIDENTLIFVAIHEEAHVMTTAVGHGNLFWSNMAFMVRTAIKLGLYKYQDFASNPVKYCGVIISSTPFNPATYDAMLKTPNTSGGCR